MRTLPRHPAIVALTGALLLGACAGDSVGYKLAAIDDNFRQVDLYEERVALLADRCGLDEESTADIIVKGARMLTVTYGIPTSNLTMMAQTLRTVPAGNVVSCNDVVAGIIANAVQ
jgi:hypothetical protein